MITDKKNWTSLCNCIMGSIYFSVRPTIEAVVYHNRESWNTVIRSSEVSDCSPRRYIKCGQSLQIIPRPFYSSEERFTVIRNQMETLDGSTPVTLTFFYSYYL